VSHTRRRIRVYIVSQYGTGKTVAESLLKFSKDKEKARTRRACGQ
jgi:hypothetical protein